MWATATAALRPRARTKDTPLGRDYYELLEIEREATDGEIKASYRKLALRWHPDRNPGDRAAEEQFKELAIAYSVLADRDKRAHYDRFGTSPGLAPFGGTDVTNAPDFFNAIFGDLFGLSRRRSTTGRDLRYTLELDFEEAAQGCEKVIVFERAEDCEACLGSGAEGGAAGLVKCARCDGEGVIRAKVGFLTGRRECLGCGGTGQVPLRVDMTYDGRSNLATETRYSDLAGTQVVVRSTYVYNGDGEITSLVDVNGSGTTVASYTYTYDVADLVQPGRGDEPVNPVDHLSINLRDDVVHSEAGLLGRPSRHQRQDHQRGSDHTGAVTPDKLAGAIADGVGPR